MRDGSAKTKAACELSADYHLYVLLSPHSYCQKDQDYPKEPLCLYHFPRHCSACEMLTKTLVTKSREKRTRDSFGKNSQKAFREFPSFPFPSFPVLFLMRGTQLCPASIFPGVTFMRVQSEFGEASFDWYHPACCSSRHQTRFS